MYIRQKTYFPFPLFHLVWKMVRFQLHTGMPTLTSVNIILLNFQKYEYGKLDQRLFGNHCVYRRTDANNRPIIWGDCKMLVCSDSSSSFKIELSIILVWPMTYATCFELLEPFDLLPYEIGKFPALHRIPRA